MKQYLLLLFLFISLRGFSQTSIQLEEKFFKPNFVPDSALLNWLNHSPDYKDLDSKSKEVVYWINCVRKSPREFYETMVISFLNTYPELRSSYTQSLKSDLLSTRSLSLLPPTALLLKTAKAHAIDLGKNARVISHSSSNGTSFQERMTKAGITKCARENIYDGKDDPLEAVILLLIDVGVPGTGHRKTILDPSIRSIGVSFQPFESEKTYVMVQDFSCE